MSLPLDFYPLFPCQLQTIDQTTGLALAAGTYSFYQDDAHATPKDVYQFTNGTYVNLGSTLTLSSVGTFVSPSGDNIIPFLWPFTGSPLDEPPSTTIELYFIRVKSSGDTPEFTVDSWPPQVIGASLLATTFYNSDNIISNPQFAVINYPSPYTFTVSGNSTIRIAPDWDIITTGSGTVTIEQIPVSDTTASGLPAFALYISSSGISTLLLSQTLEMSPRILETGYASGTFIAKSGNSNTPTIEMHYVPSDPVLTNVEIASDVITNSGYTLIADVVNLAAITTNTEQGDTGYVDIQLVIPPGNEVYISCVQLISVPNGETIANYIQESTPRQIDHLYHDAYPIAPVGQIIDFAGFATPTHYKACDGTAYSRVTYWQLFNALTLTQTITQASTTTFTVTSGTQLGLGMFVEGAGIPVGTYITVISSDLLTITVNQVTTATGSFPATFFAFGQGDGSTTFNVPNLAGKVIAGTGTNLVAISPLLDTLGQSGGATNGLVTLAANQIAPHTHPATSTSPAVGSTTGATNVMALGQTASVNYTGVAVTVGANVPSPSLQPVNITQPTIIMYKYIRYE